MFRHFQLNPQLSEPCASEVLVNMNIRYVYTTLLNISLRIQFIRRCCTTIFTVFIACVVTQCTLCMCIVCVYLFNINLCTKFICVCGSCSLFSVTDLDSLNDVAMGAG